MRRRRRKTKLPFLLLNFTLFLLLFSKFQLLKGSGSACSGCGPGSQDFWAPGSLIRRKEELCPTLWIHSTSTWPFSSGSLPLSRNRWWSPYRSSLFIQLLDVVFAPIAWFLALFSIWMALTGQLRHCLVVFKMLCKHTRNVIGGVTCWVKCLIIGDIGITLLTLQRSLSQQHGKYCMYCQEPKIP